MGSEIVQFGIMLGLFLVVFLAWLFVIYLPGRTMEGNGWGGDAEERAERKTRNVRKNKTVNLSGSRAEPLEKETTTMV